MKTGYEKAVKQAEKATAIFGKAITTLNVSSARLRADAEAARDSAVAANLYAVECENEAKRHDALAANLATLTTV